MIQIVVPVLEVAVCRPFSLNQWAVDLCVTLQMEVMLLRSCCKPLNISYQTITLNKVVSCW